MQHWRNPRPLDQRRDSICLRPMATRPASRRQLAMMAPALRSASLLGQRWESGLQRSPGFMAAAVQMVSLAMARAGLRCGIAICGASACLLALMAPALATDLIPTSETRWDGFYVGAVLGGAWSDSDWRYDNHTGSIRSALRWWGRISTSMRAESSAEVRRDLIIRLAPG